MAKFKFTATHGVHLFDLGVAFKFLKNETDSEGRGRTVYGFETDDALLAAKVLDVEGYGIQTDDDSRKAAKKAAADAKKAQAEADAKAAAEAEAAEKSDADKK